MGPEAHYVPGEVESWFLGFSLRNLSEPNSGARPRGGCGISVNGDSVKKRSQAPDLAHGLTAGRAVDCEVGRPQLGQPTPAAPMAPQPQHCMDQGALGVLKHLPSTVPVAALCASSPSSLLFGFIPPVLHSLSSLAGWGQRTGRAKGREVIHVSR